MTIYIIEIEPLESRYTSQWKSELPKQLKKSTNQEVITISGGKVPENTTPGAFLNFAGTNIFKARQIEKISKLINENKIKTGDYFLYTDAWNPTVLQLRYMVDLLDIDVRIGGLWHAGAYDVWDILGQKLFNSPWVDSAEHSMFSSYDDNFFATQFHVDVFASARLNINPLKDRPQHINTTIQTVGWPMEYMESTLKPYMDLSDSEKTDTIIFPHRVSSEKQPDIFKDLANSLPEYEFVVCQDQNLTKTEYHQLLARSKLLFSANLQETLGISTCLEGPLLNVLPMAPNRLSYSEIFINDTEWLYPSEWTESYDQYLIYKTKIVNMIKDRMQNYESYKRLLIEGYIGNKRYEKFFSGRELYQAIKDK